MAIYRARGKTKATQIISNNILVMIKIVQRKTTIGRLWQVEEYWKDFKVKQTRL